MVEFSGPAARHQTVAVKVGGVTVGGEAPVVVQSMTNTDTADADGDGSGRWRRWRAPAQNWCASPSIATKPPPPCRTSRNGCCA